MPRIYADVESHTMDWGFVDFVNGVAAIATGEDYSYFTAAGYAVDTNKNALTIFDEMPRADLEAVADYLGVSYTSETTKQTIVRAIETTLSAKYITALTVTSTAGTAEGDTHLAITGEVSGTNQLKYKCHATTAPTILYMDEPGSTWTDFDDGDDITPAETDTKIAVVEVNSDGLVVAYGSATITFNTGS